LNKVLLFVFLAAIPCALKAQNGYQQLTFGGGAGATEAYAGAQVPKITLAAFANACYYPMPDFNINVEGEAGTLAGGAIPGATDLKSFNNNYRSISFSVEIQLGLFFNYRDNAFLNVIKGFYGGIGYGWLSGNVANADLTTAGVTDRVQSSLNIVPIRLGYEYTILNQYDEPFLKLFGSYSLNYAQGRGLDGYYTAYSHSANFYNYVSVGLKYAIILRGTFGRTYNKLD